MDMYAILSKIFTPVLRFFWSLVVTVCGSALAAVCIFLLVFCLWYRINIFKLRNPARIRHLRRVKINCRPYNLLRWLLWDFLTRKKRSLVFKPYGFTLYVGRQGSGKTISMVQDLNEYRQRYPDCMIVTNFSYKYADFQMKDWRDFLEIRNGEKGVIFAIDEIHSEYSAEAWKDFPESLLSEISQQRKQKIKIVATSQVFSRVAKPIREQAFSVICCKTFFGRLTFKKEFDAAEYATSDTPYMVKKRCRPLLRGWFVQDNFLRECYDTYEKIKRMEKLKFIPRSERH